MSNEELAKARWFKSSRSNGQNNCVEVAFLDGGRVALRDTKDRSKPAHIYTAAEWDAFIEGVRGGEFDRI
jgi:hypothetical protein